MELPPQNLCLNPIELFDKQTCTDMSRPTSGYSTAYRGSKSKIGNSRILIIRLSFIGFPIFGPKFTDLFYSTYAAFYPTNAGLRTAPTWRVLTLKYIHINLLNAVLRSF